MTEAAETRLLFFVRGSSGSSRNVYSAYSHIFGNSTLVFFYLLAHPLFDHPQLLQQIQNNIIAAKEAVLSEHAQPEYHFSMLLAHIRALPENWNSETKKLLHVNAEPSLEDLLQAMSMDIESSSAGSGSAVSSRSSSNRSASNNSSDDTSSRLSTFQALLRFAIVIYALRSGHRSTGP